MVRAIAEVQLSARNCRASERYCRGANVGVPSIDHRKNHHNHLYMKHIWNATYWY